MGRYDAVIFDMDGTIVESQLDFASIRAELGLNPGVGILEQLETLPAERKRQAHDMLLQREMQAAETATLVPHAAQTLQAIRAAGLKTALLTRNAKAVMELAIRRFALDFDLAWSRENGPIKPEPIGVLRACRSLGVPPHRAICVGDYHYDIVAANAAGAASVLLARNALPDYAREANYVITSLTELPAILEI